ncbi:MAG: MFS transporter [Desulfobacteraceae bacterium]|nr:MFS transporter [Desulfobacteraceae bacterium]
MKKTNALPPGRTAALLSWAMYDWAYSAFSTIIQTFVFAAYFTRQVAADKTVASAEWGNAISMAGLIVALSGPLLGALADQTGRRKSWIAGFTLLCTIPTGLLWFIRPDPACALPALLLVAVATVGFESASIFYNAMLPSLAPADGVGRWSGWGWGFGYLGGLLCLTAALYGLVKPETALLRLNVGQAENVRATFVLAAGWHLLFALPLFLFTPDERRSRLPLALTVKHGWAQLADSLRHVRRYGHLVRFFIARMVYIDGMATLFAFGGVYAAGTFAMSAQQVLLFGIGMNVTAGLGAAVFALIDDRVGGKKVILLSLLGLLVSGSLVLLVSTQFLFWIFGLLLGIFVGPAQASSRSYLARVAPEALRNEMFGLFALSGKATAFLGPLLVGWLTLLTGSQRLGMSAILAFFLAGGLLMLTVPPDRRNA